MQFQDKELGLITTRYNARAKKVIARFQNGQFVITFPSGINAEQITKIIDEMRPQLLKLNRSQAVMLIEDGTVIDTATTKIKIQVIDQSEPYKCLTYGEDTIIYVSSKKDMLKPTVQKNINYLINNVLYKEAHKFLISKTIHHFTHFKLEVNGIKISSSKGRWGSCSSKKCINLSYYLMMLPEQLIDYVILHELAHTIEMNHSDRFWSLLDKMCGTDSRSLGTIARHYSTKELDLVKSY
ncbi:MAG: M48 family metallopeptidase [Proteiniphilum sp.]|nr:M48 family metallopeptidase [Proteiniphilum sp.]